MILDIVETDILQQFDELKQAYSGLVLFEDAPRRWVVRGNLHFSAAFEAITIEDAFSVLISLPYDYPASPPKVQETGSRITRDFHTLWDGSLCLGAPTAVRMRFLRNPRLLSFVNEQVVPFLFSFRYHQEHGRMPYGELSHGGKGIFEYYRDLFHVKSHIATLGLLKILADDNYRGHLPCPCGYRVSLRRCHGPQLRDLMLVQSAEQFLREMQAVLLSLTHEEMAALSIRNVLPKSLLKKIIKKSSEYKSEGKLRKHEKV